MPTTISNGPVVSHPATSSIGMKRYSKKTDDENGTEEQYPKINKTQDKNEDGDRTKEGQKSPIQPNQNQNTNSEDEDELEFFLKELESGTAIEHNNIRTAQVVEIEEDYESIFNEIDDEKDEEEDETDDEEINGKGSEKQDSNEVNYVFLKTKIASLEN